ncbi:transcription factor [Ganoderma sinense ZZ0214-1]|uniref:Transcription factor n=1 Tax=Ganoderma sinense ZZ0214-1 TaxID=1077348 RepID=A0A2G8SB88_9APHY|nr:transcription factor [Ganoderma sinense ZZ0214-1]
MVRSTSQTASGRARARLARSPGSPQAQFTFIADPLPTGSAVPPEWHITPSPFTSPSPPPSPCPSSPDSSVSSYTSVSSRASSPTSSRTPSPLLHKSRSSCSRRSKKDPNHVSRPLNAFIIFRKQKCPEIRAEGVERDNRIISRIVAGIWKKMSDVEKAPYRTEARLLADAHKAAHPDYRFSPQARAEPKKRRNVKRRDEVTRQRVAAIAQAALEGASMKEAAAEFDALNVQEPAVAGLEKDPSDQYTTGVFDVKAWVPPRPALEVAIPAAGEGTPFRSPLLPPSSLDGLSGMANLTISGGDGSSPLSPLGLTVKQIQVRPTSCHSLSGAASTVHQHAPTLHVVPLPEVPEVEGLELAYPPTPAYQCLPQPQMPAYAVHPSQPQGALALGDTFEADIAPATAFFSQDAYASSMAYGQVFSHDSQGYVAPAHQPEFVFGQHVPSPDVAVFGQTQLALAFDSHYIDNANTIPSSSVHHHVQPGADAAHAWPYVPAPAIDFQGFQTQDMTAFASQMQMQGFVAPVDGLSLNTLNAWPVPCVQNGQMVMQNW